MAFAAGKASCRDSGLCVSRLSMNSVIFSASIYCTAISFKNIARLCFAFRSVTFIKRFLAKGSLRINMLHTPYGYTLNHISFHYQVS